MAYCAQKCYRTRSWQVIYNYPYCIQLRAYRKTELRGSLAPRGLGAARWHQRNLGSGDQNP